MNIIERLERLESAMIALQAPNKYSAITTRRNKLIPGSDIERDIEKIKEIIGVD